MTMVKFEILEHTADQAIRAYGADLRELIESAAAGMLALLYAEPPPEAGQYLDLDVEAEAPDLLLHHCLRELLYLLEDEALAPVSLQVTEASEHAARLRVGVIDASWRSRCSGRQSRR
jgi:SHS2 domain-containing protein